MRKTVVFLFLLFVATTAQAQQYTLLECVQIALDKNIAVKQSEFDVENAEIAKADAVGNFLPNLNASASHSWNIGLNQNITTGILEDVTTQFTSMGASLGLDMYKGLQNVNHLHRANLNILAQQYRLDDMKDDVMLLVANAYLQVKFNKEQVRAQQLQVEVTQQDIENTKIQIDAGTVVPNEIYELEANLASQQQELIRLQNLQRISTINLAQLLLIEDYENFDIADEDFDVPFSEILSKNPKEIFEKALTLRNDIKLSETNLAIAEKDLAIAKGVLQPSLRGFYSYSSRFSYSDRLVPGEGFDEFPIGFVEGTNTPVLSRRAQTKVVGPLPLSEQFGLNDGHNFGLQLQVPIFNRGAARNQVKRSRVNILRSETALEQQRLDLESAINQAYNDAKGAFAFYEAAQKTLFFREQAREVARSRFELGVINVFDFVQVNQRYEAAVTNAIRAKYDYIFKLKVIEFYFGVPISTVN